MADVIHSTAELQTEVKMFRAELALYKNKFEQSESAYNQLLHSFKQFQRNRFGSKSERFVEDKNNHQIDLFADLADEAFMQADEDNNNNNNDDDIVDDGNVVNVTPQKRSDNQSRRQNMQLR